MYLDKIKAFYHDFAILERYLVDYKLLERSTDRKEYLVNQLL